MNLRVLGASLPRTGTSSWHDPAHFRAAYHGHNAEVRATIPPGHLLEYRASEGWGPLCRALALPVPETPFPWTNRRQDWG